MLSAWRRAAAARFASHWNGGRPMEARSRLAALKRTASGELFCGRAAPGAACSPAGAKVALMRSAENNVAKRKGVRIGEAPRFIEHECGLNAAGAKDGRLQTGSWPGGQEKN